MLLTVASVSMADEYAYLTIGDTSGEQSIELSNISKITFDDTNMRIHLSNGTTESIALEGLSRMFFSDGSTGVVTMMGRQPAIRLVGGTIHVNAPRDTAVTLYSIGGKTLKSVTTTSEDAQINVSSLTKGIYIVKVGSEAKKIMNK